MIVRLVVLAICLGIAGCNAAPQQIYTATGQQGHVIDCSPKRQNVGRALMAQSGPQVAGNMAASMPPPQPEWGACYAQAGNICGTRGYDVLERNPAGTLLIQCKGQ
jgi:hypothetical protein